MLMKVGALHIKRTLMVVNNLTVKYTMAISATAAVSDQKKRTSDALERRFALAKAELLQQQDSDKRQIGGESKEGKRKHLNYFSIDSQAHESDALNAPSLTPSTKKGHFSFEGYTPSRGTSGNSDPEANSPAYFQICRPVHENLVDCGSELPDRRENIVDKILHNLLQNGDSAQKYMQGSRSMKINNWLLLDNCVQGRVTSVDTRVKALQRNSKRSKKHMSTKQHKKCGSLDLPRQFHKFEIFMPMHDMWKDYVTQLLKNFGKNQVAQCLLTADLHGAILLVADCKIIFFSGKRGIMVRETAETFGIITEDNKFQVVPKRGSVFTFQADSWKITLQGDKLIAREQAS